MKTTYAVMPIGDPVRFINGTSAARRTVKTTLRNLKKWYTRLRRRTTVCVIDFKGDRQNCMDENKVPCDENTKTTMIIDQEESRNRTNENLENELKEILVNNGLPAFSLRYTVSSAMTITTDVKSVINDLTKANGPPVISLPKPEEAGAGVLREVTRT